MKNQLPFAQRHPRINFLLGLFLLVLIIIGSIWGIRNIFALVIMGLNYAAESLKGFASSTDKVIVVAMITGTVSIVGVIISSIVAKIIDYRYNIKKYLYDKREEPYKQFIDMVYQLMEDTKKSNDEKMTEEEMMHMLSDFSKGLTLWGSNKVVKKWLKYRKASLEKVDKNNLFLLEDIIYEIRKDVGLGRRLSKGDMLSFFINDIENLTGKKY